jgi:alpha-beta hydrolase superfamily lysophospholipase
MSEPLSVLPEDMEPTTRGFLTGHGGTPLAFVRWDHPEPRGRVVLSHGYGEHGERYRHTAKWLHRLGWSVTAMDHQGFGRSGGVRGDARGIKAPVEDLALVLHQERLNDMLSRGALRPVWPQVLLGHSFGGLVALLTLLWHPEAMDGLIVTAPALALRGIPLPLRLLQKFLFLVAPHKPLSVPGNKSQVCSDPVLVQRYWDDPLCHHLITASFLAALEEGAAELLPLGAELDRPMLVLEGDRDTVADPDGAEELWRAVKPELLSRHRLAGFFHEVLHDLRRAEAERITEDWLAKVFPVAQGTKAVPATTFN